MAKTSIINIRTNPETKQAIETLFSQFGITVSDAVNLFFRQSIMEGGLPFQPKIPQPNAETIAAMQEAERISRDPNTRGYRDVDLMMRELLADADHAV